jgi:hypothetical protein
MFNKKTLLIALAAGGLMTLASSARAAVPVRPMPPVTPHYNPVIFNNYRPVMPGSDWRSWSPYPLNPINPIGSDPRSWSPYPLNPINPIGSDPRTWSRYPLYPNYYNNNWVNPYINPYLNPYANVYPYGWLD